MIEAWKFYLLAKWKIPMINLITEFNTGKENICPKFKDGKSLSFRMTRSSVLESKYDFG